MDDKFYLLVSENIHLNICNFKDIINKEKIYIYGIGGKKNKIWIPIYSLLENGINLGFNYT